MKEELINVWESYERNGDGFVMFGTEEQALNHNLFEIGSVNPAQVWLTQNGKNDIEKGLPVF
jgi:hypothetical protein